MWIDCATKLPDDPQRPCAVLGFDEDSEHPAPPEIAYFSDGEWFDVGDCELAIVVTHWMPLPDPPPEQD